MKKFPYLLALVSVFFGIPLRAQDAIQWKVQVIGLRVVAPPLDGKEDSQGAFFQAPGITVVAAIIPTGGNIVSIDQFKSTVDTFTDDKGTDLLAAKSSSPFNKPGFGIMDNKKTNATVEINAAGLPAKDAKALNITGKVSLKVAAATKQFTVDNVDIKAGSAFNCGDMALKVSKAGMGKSMFSDKQEFSVTLTSATDLESISELKFLDAQGNELEAHKNSWGGGMGEYFADYTFKQPVDHAKVVATCFQDLRTVEVPLTIKAGVGL